MHTSATTKITSGPIGRTVLSLAVPVVLGMFMEIALSVVNFFWVGKLGPSAQDAVTSSMVITWTVFCGFTMINIGLTAIVSRHVGAKEPEQAAFHARQGLLMALALGLVFTVLGFILAPVILRFMHTSDTTLVHALPYLRIFFLTAVFFALYDTSASIFRASGDTKTPTVVGASLIAFQMILDPLLIFGIGPFPKLGVAGAAVATLVAISLAALVLLWFLMKGKLGYAIGTPFRTRPDLSAMRKIARIGLPITIQQLTFTAVYWFLINIVHHYGESAGAAMGIGNRMESISYLTCYGFSVAASTMVGQNLGAGNADRAARCAWSSAGLAVAFTFVISILFLTIPHFIARIFTSDPEVMAIAVDYLRILGLSQFTMAIEIVLEGSFSGAGDTVSPMVVMIPGAIARVPLAYYLCFGLDWGINGVWWTLTITTTVKAAALALWFKRGRWQAKKL
ncbi:MAG: MATE family efflux transporter [Candidatus Zixiibacteriota bacterium]